MARTEQAPVCLLMRPDTLFLNAGLCTLEATPAPVLSFSLRIKDIRNCLAAAVRKSQLMRKSPKEVAVYGGY
jgi:hypothetical protein